jgi:hypothetical protein
VIGLFRSRINDGWPSWHDALVQFQALVSKWPGSSP